MEELKFIRAGGETIRYHGLPVLFRQNVADHSFHVAMLFSLMALNAEMADGQGLTVPGLMAALTHDLAEHKTGDLPAPAKRRLDEMLPGARAAWDAMETGLLQAAGLEWESLLSERERRWLKLADAMEGCLYCIRERAMGNQTIDTTFINFASYARALLKPKAPLQDEDEVVHDLVMFIDKEWERVNGRI